MKNEIERLLNGRGLETKSKVNLELNINYICKNTIKQRKAIYGNSFPKIAELESEYLGIKITPQQVAYKMAILKFVRIEDIKAKLNLIKQNEDFNDIFVLENIKKLNLALEDSVKDYNNYLWVSKNYDEYEKI